MKKTLLVLVLVVMSLYLVGCQKSGKAIELPPDPSQPGFDMERAVSGNAVTLTIGHQALPANEIIIVAEKLPDGITYVGGSASMEPTFTDNILLIWLFARNAPQQLGVTTVSNSLPSSITYGTNVAGAAAQFRGKWGLKELNIEGLIGDADGACTPSCAGRQCGSDGCGGSCGSCSSGYSCSSGQCVSGCATIMDVLNGINNYKAGTMTILELLNVIEQYKQCV